jgi:hypothetical protein
MRYYIASWKVAVLSPDEVFQILYWLISPGRTMALGSTQPLTEMSARDLPWG